MNWKLKRRIFECFGSQAEWEYACRSGGKAEKYACGNDADRVAWYGSNSGGSTHPVGTKAPNGLGLYDMSGNLCEWCEDIYAGDAYSKHQRNNSIYAEGGSYRVLRGGNWSSYLGNDRCAVRVRIDAGDGDEILGFRLARTE